ncbi:MAG: hypothetical protein UW24_C0019G0003 [Parcubacteria group bacterium GW2011_GWA2_44_12]|jgi:uncharacterized LabA/DUF88 family protein|nr:MAG: hypothetical protein UW24_C0019G0003 [Parcubacteria group bacterium GW2011_GWA2_44_12]
MIKHKNQRVGVFVDVQNMYYSAKNLFDAKVDFGAILKDAVSGRMLIRATSYVIKALETAEEIKFYSALDKQGFEVKIKDLQYFQDGTKKGDWDVGITIDAIKMSRQLDVVVFVTGDGDFVPAVEYLQYHGLLVEVMGFGETTNAHLKEIADEYTDLSRSKGQFLIAGGNKAKR